MSRHFDSNLEHGRHHVNHKFWLCYLDFVPFDFCHPFRCKIPRMFVRKREVLRIDWPWMDFKTGWPMATVISQGSFILWSAAWLAVQQRRLAADSRDQFLPKVDSCRKLNLVNWCQADVIYEEEQVQEGERDQNINRNWMEHLFSTSMTFRLKCCFEKWRD